MYTAHFLTCYISLLVYRLLEKKLGEGFTCSQILETLHGMNMTLLSKNTTKSYKKEKYSKKLVTASTNEATGIPSTFAQPTSTTENSHHSSPKGQL